MYKSLLPPNATPLERDIEQITAAKFDVNVPVSDMWNPDTCPAHLLPWLAWGVSVDNWSADWSEQIKRNVIKSSIHVHQIKGTVDAVRQALDALGAQVELTEWFENGGVPGTFSLIAWANDNLGGGDTVLGANLYADLERSITEAKPASRHFTFQVGARFKDGLALAAGGLRTAMVRRDLATTQVAPLNNDCGISIAAHGHVRTLIRVGVI